MHVLAVLPLSLLDPPDLSLFSIISFFFRVESIKWTAPVSISQIYCIYKRVHSTA
jgi:hypothetical protein